ncbi:hypothetical protein [Aliivibrio fischeri]|uniref:hypothetical protein n=1 Tax=Aliivibrio fischeri TaxID=668 RepID=UPI000AE5ABAE|nr:hypothetical protein [Aliivibrio fischeri]USR97531.1 hypothetical protein AVFI_20420 [Aliivibrio fischeri ATCC 7744 = JCM 18803 = DSM 507]
MEARCIKRTLEDHFWIRNSEKPSLFICKREALPQFSGSDHSAVMTYLSTKSTPN